MMAYVGNTQVKIDQLLSHKRNYRSHDEQMAGLQQSLERRGQYRSIVAHRNADGSITILAGHGVVQAARANGLKEVRVDLHEGLTEEQQLEILVADNELTRHAADDRLMLSALLTELQNADVPLASAGYDDGELDKLLNELANEQLKASGAGGDDYEPLVGESRAMLGDLWQLGEHRLLCGDSTKGEDVARLFGSERARMVWTDPPYGVSYADKNAMLNAVGRGNRIQTPIEGDHMSEADTEELAYKALKLAAEHSVKGAAIYCSGPPGPLHIRFISAINRSGFSYKAGLVWLKNNHVLGRSDYQYKHEPIFYGWKEDGAHYFTDDRSQMSVFEIDKPMVSNLHPTMKPVALIIPMLQNSSKPHEIVYDPFMGSGSTMIAGERTGRRVFGCEIGARYADVILNRWEAETGLDPVLLERLDHATPY